MIALNYSGKSRFEINAGPIHLAVIPDIYLTGAMKGNWQFTLEVLKINFQKDGFKARLAETGEKIGNFVQVAQEMDVEPAQLAIAWILKMQEYL